MLLVIFFLIVIIIIVIMTAKVKIYLSVNNKNFKISIKIYILKNICIAKINPRKNKKRKKIKKAQKQKIKKVILKIIEKGNIYLEKLNLRIDICTSDPILTSYLVGAISNAVIFFIRRNNIKKDLKNCSYQIKPIYDNKKIFNIKFSSIISVNLVHIITIICKKIIEWRCDQNGRKSSNRRINVNSHE